MLAKHFMRDSSFSSPQRSLCNAFYDFLGHDRDNSESESSRKQVGDSESCSDSIFRSSSAVGIIERQISPVYRFDSMSCKNIYL